MNSKKLFGWLLLPALALLMGACEESNDEAEGGSGEKTETAFEAIPTTSTVTAKDFQMSDIDALVELSLKMEGLRVQYAKMMSNGWHGELYSGPGQFTDGQKFYDYVADLLDNEEAYTAALKRLEQDGILTKSTITRGIMLDFANWCYSLNAPKEVAYERMLTILNKNKVRGNMAAMQRLFNAVPDKHKCGETDARTWFVNLYNGDYKNKCMSIHDAWLIEGEGEGSGNDAVAQYFDTYAALYDNGPGNPRWKDSHEVIKDVAEKGGTFYVSCVDEVTGGYVGKWVDINDISEETIRLAKKIKEGKATTSDLKRFAATLGSKYVKDKAGDFIGEDPGGLEKLAGEITDYVTANAIEAADEEIAEELGMNLYEIQKNSPQGTLVTIIEDVKAGNVTIGFPNKDGDTHIVTKPGEKNVTVVTTDGERITQKVPEQKPGKVEVEAQPQETKATIKLSPEKVDMVATGGKTTVEILTNCPYARFRFNGKEPDWLSVSRKGKMLTLDAKANDSEQPRSVTFRVDVSFDGKNADTSANITITQAGFKEEDDRPQIEANQTELLFDAKGGSHTVKLDVKTYEYYGGFADDDCEDWVTVKSNGSQVSLTITVATNKTDQERTGTIYAFATNKSHVETEDDYVLLPITVRQAAGDNSQEESPQWSIFGAYVNINLCSYLKGTAFYRVVEIGNVQVTTYYDGAEFTATPNGKGLDVKVEYNHDNGPLSDGLTEHKHKIGSFTVDDLSLLESKEAKVSNVIFESVYTYNSPNSRDVTSTREESRFASDAVLPITSFDYSDYSSRDDYDIEIWWRVDGEDVTYTDFFWKYTVTHKDEKTDVYESHDVVEAFEDGTPISKDFSVVLMLKKVNKSHATRSDLTMLERVIRAMEK